MSLSKRIKSDNVDGKLNGNGNNDALLSINYGDDQTDPNLVNIHNNNNNNNNLKQSNFQILMPDPTEKLLNSDSHVEISEGLPSNLITDADITQTSSYPFSTQSIAIQKHSSTLRRSASIPKISSLHKLSDIVITTCKQEAAELLHQTVNPNSTSLTTSSFINAACALNKNSIMLPKQTNALIDKTEFLNNFKKLSYDIQCCLNSSDLYNLQLLTSTFFCSNCYFKSTTMRKPLFGNEAIFQVFLSLMENFPDFICSIKKVKYNEAMGKLTTQIEMNGTNCFKCYSEKSSSSAGSSSSSSSSSSFCAEGTFSAASVASIDGSKSKSSMSIQETISETSVIAPNSQSLDDSEQPILRSINQNGMVMGSSGISIPYNRIIDFNPQQRNTPANVKKANKLMSEGQEFKFLSLAEWVFILDNERTRITHFTVSNKILGVVEAFDA